MTQESRYDAVLIFEEGGPVDPKVYDLLKRVKEKKRIAFEEQEQRKNKANALTQKQDPPDAPEQITCGQGRFL